MPKGEPKIGEYVRYPKMDHLKDVEIQDPNKSDPNTYYILVFEWNYPTESGQDLYFDPFDTKAEALAHAKGFCEKEIRNVSRHGHIDMRLLNYTWGPYSNIGFLYNELNADGYIVIWNSNDNRTHYYYRAKIIKVTKTELLPFGPGLYGKDIDYKRDCSNCPNTIDCSFIKGDKYA